MSQDVVRIAMWSGPRNISTAMMRAWGNRSDTVVVDEPFYGSYLARTGKHHPGFTEIVAQSNTDVYKIIEGLTGPLPPGKTVFYQKHMTHHLLPEVDRQWLAAVTNCFLIRDPADVIASYIKKNDDPTLMDLGFEQQIEIFDFVANRTGTAPPVVDAKDVLQSPERILRLLCHAVGVEFDDAMLSWPAGLRETDGMWAKYWYREVANSTGFQPYRKSEASVPERLNKIHDRCRECYEKLYRYRLREAVG